MVASGWFSFFGVVGSIRPYLIGMQRQETRGLFIDAFAKFRLSMLWPLVKYSSTAVYRSLRMRKRWPFEDYEPHLDKPLDEIREHAHVVESLIRPTNLALSAILRHQSVGVPP